MDAYVKNWPLTVNAARAVRKAREKQFDQRAQDVVEGRK